MLIAWDVLAWHHVGVLLSVDGSFSNVYLPTGTKYFVYKAPAELNGDLWFLGFLKIFPIFLDSLKIVWILCLFNILPIWSVVPLTYGRMDRILSFDCALETVILFECLLIVLIISFLSCPFFYKANFKWLSSVYRYSLSEIVKALCISELTVFVLGGGTTRHIDIYLCVLVFCTFDLRYSQLS